jgi:manganese oxidase
MSSSRRDVLRGAIAAAAGWFAAKAARGASRLQTGQQQSGQAPQQEQEMQMHHHHASHPEAQKAPPVAELPPGSLGPNVLPVETPDVGKLTWTTERGVKVFRLVAEPVKQKILPGTTLNLWGYNGSSPGPTIEANEGDRVRIIFENHLPEPTAIHWHGLEVPVEMDGMPGISQPHIQPGEVFVYEFTLNQNGTFFYHSHMPMQQMFGMLGLFILHPKEAYRPRVDKDFGFLLQEYAVLPNNTIPNTLSMEYNWLVMNGKAAPATTPLIVRQGDRVRVRLANLGMDHHPIHLHGNTFRITGTEAGRIPEAMWMPGNTVLVGVAQARDVEFVANNPGDWMLHCHMPHHNMNHMASMIGPMTSMEGMPMGMSMENGMGMISRGAPLDKEHGPSLGRGIGLGADFEKATTNATLAPKSQEQSQQPQESDMGHQHPASSPQDVPGYPQDADMGMEMDEDVAKPENTGLMKGWSADMMGMMTLVRVLPAKQYDDIRERISRARQGA